MSNAPRSSATEAAMLVARLLHDSNRAASHFLAELFDLKPETCRGLLAKFDEAEAREKIRRLCASVSDRPATVQEVVTAQKAEDEAARLRLKIRNIAREHGELLESHETLLGIRGALRSPTPIRPTSSGRSRLSFIATRADAHGGKEVRPEDVHGLQRYDPDVCSARIRRCSQITVRLIRDMGVGVDAIILAYNGDNMNGELRDDDIRANLETPAEQAVRLVADAEADVSYVAEAFPKARIIVCWTYGNHPRLTLKPGSEDVHNNLEYVCGRFLASRFEGDKRIQVVCPKSPDIFVDIYGRNYLLTHGDRTGAKGGDGQIGMAGPTIRGAQRIESQIDSIRRYVPEQADHSLTIMSHWHEYLRHKRLLVTGSIIGPESYGAKTRRFTYAPAEQSLVAVHRERGVVGDHRIWPGDPSEGPLYGPDAEDATRKALAQAGEPL